MNKALNYSDTRERNSFFYIPRCISIVVMKIEKVILAIIDTRCPLCMAWFEINEKF